MIWDWNCMDESEFSNLYLHVSAERVCAVRLPALPLDRRKQTKNGKNKQTRWKRTVLLPFDGLSEPYIQVTPQEYRVARRMQTQPHQEDWSVLHMCCMKCLWNCKRTVLETWHEWGKNAPQGPIFRASLKRASLIGWLSLFLFFTPQDWAFLDGEFRLSTIVKPLQLWQKNNMRC